MFFFSFAFAGQTETNLDRCSLFVRLSGFFLWIIFKTIIHLYWLTFKEIRYLNIGFSKNLYFCSPVHFQCDGTQFTCVFSLIITICDFFLPRLISFIHSLKSYKSYVSVSQTQVHQSENSELKSIFSLLWQTNIIYYSYCNASN